MLPKLQLIFSSQSIYHYLKQSEAEVSTFHAGSVFLPPPECWIQPLPQQWGKEAWGLKDLHLSSRLGFYELSCLPWQMGMGTHLQGWHGFPFILQKEAWLCQIQSLLPPPLCASHLQIRAPTVVQTLLSSAKGGFLQQISACRWWRL